MLNILRRSFSDEKNLGDAYHSTPFQQQIHQLLDTFVAQASDWRLLSAMTMASLAYRLGNIAFLKVGASCKLPLSRFAAPLFGLASEVTAFRSMSHLLNAPLRQAQGRLLTPTLSPGERVSVRTGEGGGIFGKEWLTTFTQFAALKFFGHFAQGQNLVFTHTLQASGMVAGHQLAYGLGLATKPEGNLLNQWVQAEVVNMQLGAGMALSHHLTQGKILALEKSLDLQIQFHENIFSPDLLNKKGAFIFPQNLGWSSYADPAFPSNLWMAQASSAEYWYPSGIRGSKKPPRLSYPFASEEVIAKLEEQIDEGSEEKVNLFSREAIFSHRADENHVNWVWFYQLLHFVGSLEGSARIYKAQRLLEPFASQQGLLSGRVLGEALAALREKKLGPDSEKIMEVTLPYDQVRFGREDAKLPHTELSYLLEQIEGDLKGYVRLVEAKPGQMILRIPSVSLLEQLLRISGGQEAPSFYYVHGEVSRNFAMILRSLGLAPIGISREATRLGDLGARVHPWVFTLHDIYHASTLARFTGEFRQIVGEHYQFLLASPLARDPLLQEHLNRLSDFDPPHYDQNRAVAFLEFSLSYLEDQLRKDSASSVAILSRLIRSHRFLSAYLQCLRGPLSSSASRIIFRNQLESEMNALLVRMNAMLRQVQRLGFKSPQNPPQSPLSP